MSRPTALERAFELARSGKIEKIEFIKKTLKSEKYSSEEVGQLVGRSLSTQLNKLIANSSPRSKPLVATGAQLKAARDALGWTRGHVAAQLGVPEKAIGSAETKSRPSAIMVDRLQAFYDAAGVEFTIGDLQGVRRKANTRDG